MLSERLESSPPMSFRNRPVLPRALSGGPTLARKPRILRPPPPTEGPACPDGPSQQMKTIYCQGRCALRRSGPSLGSPDRLLRIPQYFPPADRQPLADLLLGIPEQT